MNIYKELFPNGVDGTCQQGDSLPSRSSVAEIRAVCALADELRAFREMLKPLVDYALKDISINELEKESK